MELFYLLLLIVVYLVGTACAERCADYNPIPGIVTCLSKVTFGINNTNVLAGTETNTIRTYCDEGLFRTSVECLEAFYRVKDECSTTEAGLHLLLRNNMPIALNQSVHRICSNLHEHAKHSDCIVTKRHLIQDCLRRNDVAFRQTQDKTSKPTVQSVGYNMCRYYKGMEVCTGKYIENQCDKDIGVLIGQFISTVNPLNCSSFASLPTSASGPRYGGNYIYGHITLSVIVTYFVSSFHVYMPLHFMFILQLIFTDNPLFLTLSPIQTTFDGSTIDRF